MTEIRFDRSEYVDGWAIVVDCKRVGMILHNPNKCEYTATFTATYADTDIVTADYKSAQHQAAEYIRFIEAEREELARRYKTS